jgi:hypothetical protein
MTPDYVPELVQDDMIPMKRPSPPVVEHVVSLAGAKQEPGRPTRWQHPWHEVNGPIPFNPKPGAQSLQAKRYRNIERICQPYAPTTQLSVTHTFPRVIV